MIGRLRISFTSIYLRGQHGVPGRVHRAYAIDLFGRVPTLPVDFATTL
jgi:hypothetical protein